MNPNLEQLAIQAQGYPRGSQERRLALKKLIEVIYKQSNQFSRPYSSKYPSHLCSEIFTLAFQRALIFVYYPDKNIEGYHSELGTVKTWLNVKLDRRFFQEAYQQLMNQKKPCISLPLTSDSNFEDSATSLGKIGNKFNISTVNDIPDLQAYQSNPLIDNQSILEQVIQYLQEDPENILEKEHISGCPEANFKVIALKHLNREKWADIAEQFGIKSHSTVSSFYYRGIGKFRSKIISYIQN